MIYQGMLSVKPMDLGLVDLQDSTLQLDAPLISWIQLDRAYREATRSLEHRLAVHSLTRTSATILLALRAKPEGVELKTLLNVTGLLHAGMSGALSRMEREGLCVRTHGDGQDLRAVTVMMTRKGEGLLTKALSDYESWAVSLIGNRALAQKIHATVVALSTCAQKNMLA